MGFSPLSLSPSLSFFLFLFYFHSTLSSSSPPPLCAYHQSLSLLQFKQSFSIQTYPYEDLTQYPKTESWKEGTDCCLWDGVTCDLRTGLVTGLDLSSSMLHGTLHSNNSLFSLHHLRKLDLSFNDFTTSHISSRFGQFSNLTHLNLSSSLFEGQVPSEISHLSKLVSLDLSGNSYPSLEPISFDKIARNLTKLRELDLSSVNMSLVVPGSLMNLSSSLSSLRLDDCGLQGKRPSSMGKLKRLRYLDLGFNNFTGSIPYDFEQLSELVSLDLSENSYLSAEPVSLYKIVQNLTKLRVLALDSVDMSLVVPGSLMNLSSSLSSLILRYCGLQGKLPSSMGKLKHLRYLDLGSNNFTGSIPYDFEQLSELVLLDLSENNYLSAEPVSIYKIVQNLTKLRVLTLDSIDMSLVAPNSLTNLSSSLSSLSLQLCGLQGKFPGNIFLLPNLETLYLSYNEGLTGSFPSSNLSNVLSRLDLSNTRISLYLENDLISNLKSLRVMSLVNSSIIRLDLALLSNLTQLTDLDLSSNKLSGQIPSSLGNLIQLIYLDLSNNILSGNIPSSLGNLLQLRYLHLHFNNFNGTIPSSLSALPSLQNLDLHSNNLIGNISEFQHDSLAYLDLSNNNLHGTIPSSIFIEESLEVKVLDLSDNNFTGEIPKVIGNLKALQQLNLSHNSLTGHIQSSLGILTNLESLDLSSNLLTGRIPTQLGGLTFLGTLNLSHNQLEGPLPSGLQFSTFNATSFEGNLRLCGFPVLKKCYRDGDQEQSLPPSSYNEGDDSTLFGDGFGWKAVAMGYGCGFLLGVVQWDTSCLEQKNLHGFIGWLKIHGNSTREKQGRKSAGETK